MGIDGRSVKWPEIFWLCVYPETEGHKQTWIGGPGVQDLETGSEIRSCGNRWFAIPVQSILYVAVNRVLGMIHLCAIEGLPPGFLDISYR